MKIKRHKLGGGAVRPPHNLRYTLPEANPIPYERVFADAVAHAEDAAVRHTINHVVYRDQNNVLYVRPHYMDPPRNAKVVHTTTSQEEKDDE